MKTDRIASLVAVLALGIVLGGGAIYFWSSRSDAFSRTAQTDGEHADDHADDEDHTGDGERRNEGLIRLSPVALREFGIEVRSAGAGQVVRVLTLPGEIVLNADQVAHIVPRVGGIVKRVDKRLGDTVKLGEVMAVLESRELAEAKASYLAAAQRLDLARATFTSSEELATKGILPELEFLAVRRERDEAGIRVRAAEHQLYALGLTHEETAGISQEGDEVFSIYELRAPFAGTVIEKHITLGEVVTNESDVFELADLSTVWVNLTVYQKDLATVSVDQSVVISAGHGVPEASGTIEYVSPVIEEATRTATARLVLPNPDGHWRPGLFVTGEVQVEAVHVDVLIPKTALQRVDERTVVFVETDEGLELRPVTVGRSDNRNVEISEGLNPGDRYVSTNAFTLTSELEKAGFEAGHGH